VGDIEGHQRVNLNQARDGAGQTNGKKDLAVVVKNIVYISDRH